MESADIHTESARIRNILEVTAFDLATLEYNLANNAYIPSSTNEQEIRDATYRLYQASTSHPPQFYVAQGRFNIFEPYPHGGAPQFDLKMARNAQITAAMIDRNERESLKYDAVTDLIRMLATRKANEATAAEAHVKVDYDTAKITQEELEAERAKTKAAERKLGKLRNSYDAVKRLVGEEHNADVHRIEKRRGRIRVKNRNNNPNQPGRVRRRLRRAAEKAANESFQAKAEPSIFGASTGVRVKDEQYFKQEPAD